MMHAMQPQTLKKLPFCVRSFKMLPPQAAYQVLDQKLFTCCCSRHLLSLFLFEILRLIGSLKASRPPGSCPASPETSRLTARSIRATESRQITATLSAPTGPHLGMLNGQVLQRETVSIHFSLQRQNGVLISEGRYRKTSLHPSLFLFIPSKDTSFSSWGNGFSTTSKPELKVMIFGNPLGENMSGRWLRTHRQQEISSEFALFNCYLSNTVEQATLVNYLIRSLLGKQTNPSILSIK